MISQENLMFERRLQDKEKELNEREKKVAAREKEAEKQERKIKKSVVKAENRTRELAATSANLERAIERRTAAAQRRLRAS